MFDLTFQNSKNGLESICVLYMYKKKTGTYMNSKFSGQGKVGWKQFGVRNIKKPEQDDPVNRPIPIWARARSSIAGGIFLIF